MAVVLKNNSNKNLKYVQVFEKALIDSRDSITTVLGDSGDTEEGLLQKHTRDGGLGWKGRKKFLVAYTPRGNGQRAVVDPWKNPGDQAP